MQLEDSIDPSAKPHTVTFPLLTFVDAIPRTGRSAAVVLQEIDEESRGVVAGHEQDLKGEHSSIVTLASENVGMTTTTTQTYQ